MAHVVFPLGGAALEHQTASVCPTPVLGCPRRTSHLKGCDRTLDPTNVFFSLSFPLLGTWHHNFPSCLIQSLRINPGLFLFFTPYIQPICKTQGFSLQIWVLLSQARPPLTQPPRPLCLPCFLPHPWLSSLTQHLPAVLKIKSKISSQPTRPSKILEIWPLPHSLGFASHPLDS